MRAGRRLVRAARRRDDPVRRLQPRAGPGLGARPGRRGARLLRRRVRVRPRAGPRRRGSATSRSPTDSTTPPTSTPTSSRFELFDHGVPIVNDTGLYHKDPGEIRDFVLSNRAHSGLAVDGLDLPIADGDLAYGSGLTAAGDGRRLVRDRGPQPVAEAAGRRALAPLPLSPRRRPGDRRRPGLRARPHLHPLPAAASRGRARRGRRGRDADQRAGVRRRDLRRRGRQPGRCGPRRATSGRRFRA